MSGHPMDFLAKNRADFRGELARRNRRVRPPGMGSGKHAMNGKKFRCRHVNWFERIVKEMKGHAPVENAVLSGKLDRYLRGG